MVDVDFTSVNALRPGVSGCNLNVKVVRAKVVVNRPKGDGTMVRVNECLVGDDTGVIVFTAKNEQVDTMSPGKTLTIKNAKIDVYKGCMRLMVDKSGTIEDAEAGLKVKPKVSSFGPSASLS